MTLQSVNMIKENAAIKARMQNVIMILQCVNMIKENAAIKTRMQNVIMILQNVNMTRIAKRIAIMQKILLQ